MQVYGRTLSMLGRLATSSQLIAYHIVRVCAAISVFCGNRADFTKNHSKDPTSSQGQFVP